MSAVAGVALAALHLGAHAEDAMMLAAIGLPTRIPSAPPPPPATPSPPRPVVQKPIPVVHNARPYESAALDGTIKFGMHMGTQTSFVPDLCIPMKWSDTFFSGVCYHGHPTLQAPAGVASADSNNATSLDSGEFKLNALGLLWHGDKREFSVGLLYGFQSVSHDETQALTASGGTAINVASNVDFQVHHFGLSSVAAFRSGRLSLRGSGELTYTALSGVQKITMDPEVPVYVDADAEQSGYGVYFGIKGEARYRLNNILDLTLQSRYQITPAPYNTIDVNSESAEPALSTRRVTASITRAEVGVGTVFNRISSFNLHPFMELGYYRDAAKATSAGSVYTSEGTMVSLGLTSAF